MVIVCLGSQAIPLVNEDSQLPKGWAFLPRDWTSGRDAPVHSGCRPSARPQAERQHVDAPGHRQMVQSDQGLRLHRT